MFRESCNGAVNIVVKRRRSVTDPPGRVRVAGTLPIVFVEQNLLDHILIPPPEVVQMVIVRMRHDRARDKSTNRIDNGPIEIGRVPEFILRVPADPVKLPYDESSKEVLISWKDEKEKENKLTLALEPITCYVDIDMCRGCGKCEKVCEYKAISMRQIKEGVLVSEIDEAVCKGCGTCVAICTTGAIKARHFSDKRIEQMLESCLGQDR